MGCYIKIKGENKIDLNDFKHFVRLYWLSLLPKDFKHVGK